MVGREREYCDAGRVVAISCGSETGPWQGGHDPRAPPSLAHSVGSVWRFRSDEHVQPRLRCHCGRAEFSRWSRRSGRRPPPMRHPWVEKNHGLAALRQARTIPRIWATRGSKVSQRSGGDHHPPGGWVPAVYDTAPTPGRCQVRQGSSRSVEMRGVDNVDQRFTVDQSA